jgi:hypothetical protein
MAARDWGSGTAIELALSSAPQLLPKLLRQGIRKKRGRLIAAAVLGLLDRPWCSEALASVLRESDDCAHTAAVRSILRNSTDPAMQQLVADWEATHRCQPETEKRTEDRMAETISRLTDVVNAVRDQIPNP